MEHESPECALCVQVCQVELAQQGIRGEEEIQADQQSARPGHPLDFAQSQLQVGEIPQAVADEDAIEG